MCCVREGGTEASRSARHVNMGLATIDAVSACCLHSVVNLCSPLQLDLHPLFSVMWEGPAEGGREVLVSVFQLNSVLINSDILRSSDQ